MQGAREQHFSWKASRCAARSDKRSDVLGSLPLIVGWVISDMVAGDVDRRLRRALSGGSVSIEYRQGVRSEGMVQGESVMFYFRGRVFVLGMKTYDD